MMFHNCKAEVKVYHTDEGWILEWEIKPPEQDRNFGMIERNRPEPKTRGIRTFSSKKELMKSLEGLL